MVNPWLKEVKILMIEKTSSLESGSRTSFMLMEYKKNENDGVVACGNEIVGWKIFPHSQGHVDASKFNWGC